MSDVPRQHPPDVYDEDGNWICPECSDEPSVPCALCGNEGGED